MSVATSIRSLAAHALADELLHLVLVEVIHMGPDKGDGLFLHDAVNARDL